MGKSVCAAIAEMGDDEKDFADLHDFAESYLLDSRQLPKDSTDEHLIDAEHKAKLSPEQSPQRSGIGTNGVSFWNEDNEKGRLATNFVTHKEQPAVSATIMEKVVPEPLDSSDWDQTQERFGSQAGGQKTANTNSTESPESVLNTRSNAPPSTSEVQRLISNPGGAATLPKTEEYLPRDGSGSNLAAEQPGDNHPQSYSRLLGLDDEPVGRGAGSRGEGLWEGRGSTGNIFHNQPFHGTANQGQAMHNGLSGVENRGGSRRDSWTSDEMTGNMKEVGWGSRYPGRSHTPGMSRLMSDDLGARFPSVANPRRQYSEDLYDAPRGSLDLLSGPGASPLDAMLGEQADMSRSAIAQGDMRGRHMRSKSHGMPPQSPARPTGPYYSPPVPGTPADGTRKRRREAYHQLTEQDGQHLTHHSSGSRMMQDDLIARLKQQIAGLDQHTKSLMKMTLYRISRNANDTAEGVRDSSHQNPRNAYLDKVVANFMYNRFSRSTAPRSNYMASGDPVDPANYFGRSCSNPEMTHSLANQSLDMEP